MEVLKLLNRLRSIWSCISEIIFGIILLIYTPNKSSYGIPYNLDTSGLVYNMTPNVSLLPETTKIPFLLTLILLKYKLKKLSSKENISLVAF